MAAEPAAPRGGGARKFLVTALLLTLSFGTLLGALIAATMTVPVGPLAALPGYAARLAHGHAQVFGFAALFVMGVAYHALPRLKSAPLAAPALAAASYWLQTGGVLAIAVGAFLDAPLGRLLHGAGALALLSGALAFARVVAGTLAAGPPSAEDVEPWLLAGCGWLVVASGLAVAVAGGAAAQQPAMWDAALYGFVGSWIFGFSLRMLPAFLRLPAAPGGRRALALAYQAAVLAWVTLAALQPFVILPRARMAAGAALCAVVLLYVARLGIATRRALPGERLADRFFDAAYAWLVAWLVCVPGASALAGASGAEVPPLVVDFGRHAFTFGFLTQMVVGVAMRILPALAGTTVWSPRWRAATFWLLNGAVAVRAIQVVVALGGPPVLWRWLALSGVLGFAAMLAFTVNLAMTLRGAGSGPAPVPGRPVRA